MVVRSSLPAAYPALLAGPGLTFRGEPVRPGKAPLALYRFTLFGLTHVRSTVAVLASDGLEKCIPCLVNFPPEM